VTQVNAAGAEQSASAAEELTSQARAMNKIVAQLLKMLGSDRKHIAETARVKGHQLIVKGGHSCTNFHLPGMINFLIILNLYDYLRSEPGLKISTLLLHFITVNQKKCALVLL